MSLIKIAGNAGTDRKLARYALDQSGYFYPADAVMPGIRMIDFPLAITGPRATARSPEPPVVSV